MPLLRRIRGWFSLLRHTPLHPQWLLGNNRATAYWVSQRASGRVLDIGCADRWIARHLALDVQYFSLDYPPTGRALYEAKPDVFGDATRLPFADASVDTVLLLEVLEHLHCPADSLSEIARVLRPGGVLLLTLPFLYPVHDAPYDYQRYTAHGMKRELEMAGLSTCEITPAHGSAESAGVLFNLALGGMAVEAIARRSPSVVLVPLVMISIAVINLTCWLLGKLLPRWPAFTAGYRVIAIRP